MLQLLVATKGFAHIKGVLARLSPGRVVAIVADHTAEYAISVPSSRRSSVLWSPWQEIVPDNVPQTSVEPDRGLVAFSHEEINEPGILLFAPPLQSSGQAFGKAEPSVLGSNGEGRDVTVPREIIFHKLYKGGVFFHFAHH